MSWKKVSALATEVHSKRGLQTSVVAGALCKQAEMLYPDLFHAVSVKKTIMHIEVTPQNCIAYKLIEGQLLQGLQTWAKRHGFTVVTGFTLTITAG